MSNPAALSVDDNIELVKYQQNANLVGTGFGVLTGGIFTTFLLSVSNFNTYDIATKISSFGALNLLLMPALISSELTFLLLLAVEQQKASGEERQTLAFEVRATLLKSTLIIVAAVGMILMNTAIVTIAPILFLAALSIASLGHAGLGTYHLLRSVKANESSKASHREKAIAHAKESLMLSLFLPIIAVALIANKGIGGTVGAFYAIATTIWGVYKGVKRHQALKETLAAKREGTRDEETSGLISEGHQTTSPGFFQASDGHSPGKPPSDEGESVTNPMLSSKS